MGVSWPQIKVHSNL